MRRRCFQCGGPCTKDEYVEQIGAHVHRRCVDAAQATVNRSAIDHLRAGQEAARAVPCPKCGAVGGRRCVGSRNTARVSNHRERTRFFRRTDVVHILMSGVSMCGMVGTPGEWPSGHRWAAYNTTDPVDLAAVNCDLCAWRHTHGGCGRIGHAAGVDPATGTRHWCWTCSAEAMARTGGT